MNKTIAFISLITISFWAITVPVSAQEQTGTQETQITTKDLGVENPGILPSSPFYFLKEWKRGLTKLFTTDPAKKAQLELNEANERAAEIKKMEETAPQKISAISKAITKYQENTERLKNRLEALKETSQNPNVDKLLDNLVDRSLKHQQLFDELKEKFENQTQLKEQVQAAQEKIDTVITEIPGKIEDADAFRQRLEKVIEKQPEGVLKEVQAVEIIDKIKEKLPELQQQKIQELKDELINKFENRVENLEEAEKEKILTPKVLKNLPGDMIQRIQIKAKSTATSTDKEENKNICIQVITPAVSPEGKCQEFSTPCEVPTGWKKIDKCSAATSTFCGGIRGLMCPSGYICQLENYYPDASGKCVPENSTNKLPW